MFSSLPLGYNHPIFDDSFDEKVKYISRLRMCNNLFESDELIEFTASLKEIGSHKNIHFCSTGALAVESALKCAFEFKRTRPLLFWVLRIVITESTAGVI